MKNDRDENIRYLFEPRSVAIIGASTSRAKIGNSVVRNIIAGGYAGKVYPINPAGGKIEGLPAFPSILDVKDDEIDVVVITVPANLVFEAVKQSCERGVKYAIIITSGFSEVGRVKEERQITNYARNHGMRILGPNIFGIVSMKANLNATFAAGGMMPRGNLAMITQSGALGAAMVGQMTVENIGLSAVVPVGNKADIDESDLLLYLMEQDDTRVILIYVEGIREGARLLAILRQVTERKPVVFIKAGRSARGAMAAASHTGSLAGSDEVFDNVIKQCGALRAESIRDACNWCRFLAENPLPRGDNTVIITNGGGAGVMATDAAEKYGVRLYDDVETLKTIFAPAVPAFGSTKNPVDLTGQATITEYNQAFSAALTEDNIHAAIGVYCESALFGAETLAQMIEPNYTRFKEAGKPLLFTLLGGPITAEYGTGARKRGIPVASDVYETVSCLGAMYAYGHYKAKGREEFVDAQIDVAGIAGIIAEAKRSGHSFLLPYEAQTLMQLAGVATPKSLRAVTLDAAIRSAQSIGFPVVMKVISRDILHKSDAGGIALDLQNSDEVADAYGAILRNCRQHVPQAVIEGVEICEMVKPGTEMIVGARIDPSFGSIVMVGLGGIYVEVLKDVSFRAVPLARQDIIAMIQQIRSYPLLLGVRGEARKDIDSLIDTIIRLGAIITKCHGISDIEINPLVVYEQGQGARAVDVRIILSKDQQEVEA